MAYKVSALCMIAFLLLSFTLVHAARPEPAVFSDTTPMKIPYEDVEPAKVEVEGSCEGVDEEECLIRRSLAAHTDYIYTQKNKP